MKLINKNIIFKKVNALSLTLERRLHTVTRSCYKTQIFKHLVPTLTLSHGLFQHFGWILNIRYGITSDNNPDICQDTVHYSN